MSTVDAFRSNFDIRFRTGIIRACKLQAHSYLIQPTTGGSGNYITGIPLSVGNSVEGTVVDSAIYKIGDYVLFADMEPGYSDIIPSALIIAKVPQLVYEYIDLPAEGLKETPKGNEYNQQELQLLDEESNFNANFLFKSWSEEKFGGDWTIESDQVLLRVSEYFIKILGGGAGVTVNAVDSSVTNHGNVENKFFATEQKLGTIAGDTALVEEVIPKKPILFSDKDLEEEKDEKLLEKELASSRKLSGAIPYGSIKYTLGESVSKGNIKHSIYASDEERRDGSRYMNSIRGFEITKTDYQEGMLPKYPQSLVVDDKLKNLDKLPKDTDRTPFDRVTDSDFWEKILSEAEKADNMLVRKPGDRLNADGMFKDPDGSGNVIQYFKGKASISYLDNGGIVIRDAWGSEIRMEDGDIQISAARHLKYVAGGDMLGVLGGVSSLSAKKGIDLGSVAGNVNIDSKNLNITADSCDAEFNRIRVQVTDLVLNIDKVLNLASDSTLISIKNLYQLVSKGEIQILSDGRAVIAGSGSAVDCAGGIHIAATSTIVHGPVNIVHESYDLGEIQGVNTNIAVSWSSLNVQGNITARDLAVETTVLAGGRGAFGSVVVNSPPAVKGGWGVLKGTVNAPKVPKAQYKVNKLKDPFEKVERGITDKTKPELLYTMFDKTGETDYIVVPKFNETYENISAVGDVSWVVLGSKSRYIYPGESFWKKKGLVKTTNLKEALYIRDEELEKAPSIGVKDLRLNK